MNIAGRWIRFRSSDMLAWRGCPKSYDGDAPQIRGTKVAALVVENHDGWTWSAVGNAGQTGLATRSEAVVAADAALAEAGWGVEAGFGLAFGEATP